MTDYPCPNCYANCRTPETLGIHLKRCRAMSVEEIAKILSEGFLEHGRIVWSPHDEVAKKLHTAMVAKLRGRK
jgi:hypothetical protein